MEIKIITERLIGDIERQWPQTSQLIVVQNEHPSSQVAPLFAMEKQDNKWLLIAGPFRAMIGRNGFAPANEKREGDGRTPTGAFPLGLVFGYEEKTDTKMPYMQVTGEDVWVDDPGSPDYNCLAKKGKTAARSFEEMHLTDDRYKYGIVVGYNINPVVPGKGSAIFVHVWQDGETATSGCIAVSEEDILKLIRWLDPAKRPVIVLGK